MNIISRLELLRKSKNLSWGELCKLLKISRTMLHYIRTGDRNLSTRAIWRLEQAEREAGLAQKSESNVTPVYVKAWQSVKIFGLAQACTMKNPPCDDPPSNEYDLPEIPWPNKGKKRMVGFKVEGNSMVPELRNGMIAVCDCDAEIKNGNIVVAKFDDVAVIKRYRRVGNTCLFTSDNSADGGKDYEVPCKKIDWMIKVIGFHGTLG